MSERNVWAIMMGKLLRYADEKISEDMCWREPKNFGDAWIEPRDEEEGSGRYQWGHSQGMHKEFDGYGNVMTVMDGEDMDLTACGSDCGYCGRCSY